MPVCHVHARCSQRSEEGSDPLKLELQRVASCPWELGTKPKSSPRAAITAEPSLLPPLGVSVRQDESFIQPSSPGYPRINPSQSFPSRSCQSSEGHRSVDRFAVMRHV